MLFVRFWANITQIAQAHGFEQDSKPLRRFEREKFKPFHFALLI